MPGIVGASRPGAAMAHRKRRGNASARSMVRWRERSSRHRDMCAVRIAGTRGASVWPSPAARAVRACLARDAAGAWIVLRTAFSFPVALGYWLEGGGGKRGAAGPAPSRRRCSRTAVCAGEGRTLGSGSHERAGAFDGSGANGRTAAGCGERAPRCPPRPACRARTRCTPRARLRTTERVGAAISLHCMCRRTCTVRSKWQGTVSGPGVGAGYRRTPWHDAQATRWLASATRRTVRAGKCARRTPGGSRRRGCVAAQEAVGGPCGPERPRRDSKCT